MFDSRKYKTFVYFQLTCFMMVTVFPIYWILVTSLKPNSEVFARHITYLPHHLTFSNYSDVFINMGFGQYFVNSLIVSIVSTVIVLFFALLGGYAMSRFNFKLKGVYQSVLMLTQMFPAVVLMIPLFKMMNGLGLIDSLWSLIITCSVTNLPFCLFMMLGYYNTVSVSLEESAMIDGCTRIGAVFKILLPTMVPALVATGSYVFINTWNIFVYATVFITKQEKYTIPVALNIFQGEFNVNYAGLAAACMVALVPVVLIFLLIQKQLTSGKTDGAVKE